MDRTCELGDRGHQMLRSHGLACAVCGKVVAFPVRAHCESIVQMVFSHNIAKDFLTALAPIISLVVYNSFPSRDEQKSPCRFTTESPHLACCARSLESGSQATAISYSGFAGIAQPLSRLYVHLTVVTWLNEQDTPHALYCTHDAIRTVK